jgi:hypothetical protein
VVRGLPVRPDAAVRLEGIHDPPISFGFEDGAGGWFAGLARRQGRPPFQDATHAIAVDVFGRWPTSMGSTLSFDITQASSEFPGGVSSAHEIILRGRECRELGRNRTATDTFVGTGKRGSFCLR